MVKIRIGHDNESFDDYFIRLDDDEAKILALELDTWAKWHISSRIGVAFMHVAKALEVMANDKQV